MTPYFAWSNFIRLIIRMALQVCYASATLTASFNAFSTESYMNRTMFRQNILELVRRTSAFLPPDVENVIHLQRKLETSGSKAEFALELVAQNIGLAKARSLPICQDTG